MVAYVGAGGGFPNLIHLYLSQRAIFLIMVLYREKKWKHTQSNKFSGVLPILISATQPSIHTFTNFYIFIIQSLVNAIFWQKTSQCLRAKGKKMEDICKISFLQIIRSTDLAHTGDKWIIQNIDGNWNPKTWICFIKKNIPFSLPKERLCFFSSKNI